MESISELRKICQKTKEEEVSKYAWLVRRISIYFTWFLLHTRITANQVTILSLFIIIIGVVLFALDIPVISVLAMLTIEFALVLDCIDGEIARYRKASSWKGEFLDILSHIIAKVAIVTGLTFNVYNHHQKVSILILGFVGVLSSFDYTALARYIMFFERLLKEQLTNRDGILQTSSSREIMEKPNRTNPLIRLFAFFIHQLRVVNKKRREITNTPLVNLLTVSTILDLVLMRNYSVRLIDLVFFLYITASPIQKINAAISDIKGENLERRYKEDLERFRKLNRILP